MSVIYICTANALKLREWAPTRGTEAILLHLGSASGRGTCVKQCRGPVCFIVLICPHHSSRIFLSFVLGTKRKSGSFLAAHPIVALSLRKLGRNSVADPSFSSTPHSALGISSDPDHLFADTIHQSEQTSCRSLRHMSLPPHGYTTLSRSNGSDKGCLDRFGEQLLLKSRIGG